jgi:hypothetical protein
MAVSFLTPSQHMTFVNHATGIIQPPHQLSPGTLYDIYLYLKNDSSNLATGIYVKVTSSGFGINSPGGVVAHIGPVIVPPALDAQNPGLAVVEFSFTTSPGGHECLYALIEPNGPGISQNIDVQNVPIGQSSTLSFLVYGGPVPQSITLTLAEKFQDGSDVPTNASWDPLFIPPPGTGPTAPTPPPVTLNMAANTYYSVGLKVTIASNATVAHVFHIEGFINGAKVGEVDKIVNPLPQQDNYLPPEPYITGGYQSPDIVLTVLTGPNAGHEIPLGGQPGGVWDTILTPDTDYGFTAILRNASTSNAVNTVVRFWRLPGGLSASGSFLDVKTADVPGTGAPIRVTSSVPFRSAHAGHHACAVVSIYNSQSVVTATVDALSVGQIPNCEHSVNLALSSSAWRNTDSKWIEIGIPWKLLLAVEWPIHIPGPDPGPVEVQLMSRYVPRAWQARADIKNMERVRGELGGGNGSPLFLLSDLQKTFKTIDLGIEVKPENELLKVESSRKQKGAGQSFKVHTGADRRGGFYVTGTVPRIAKAGDVFLVLMTAKYKKIGDVPARDVQFLEVLYVKGRGGK